MEQEHPEENIPGAFPTSDVETGRQDNGVPVVPLLGRGMNPFRIGFAGRGGRGGPPRLSRLLRRGNEPGGL